MQYEPVAQRLAMVMPLASEDFKRDPKIGYARCALLIVLSIELVRIISYLSWKIILLLF